MRNMIKGLLFDKDGTLFDFNATWGKWCAEFITEMSGGDAGIISDLSAALEYDFPNKVFLPQSLVITDSMDVIIRATHSVLSDRKYQDIFDYALESGATAKLFPVVPLPALFAQFRQNGLKLGIATNDNEMPAKAHLITAGIPDAFDFVAGCDTGFGAKPAPEMLLAFCDATGLRPDEVAMIGDSNHDLRAGRAAGMLTIGVLTGPATAKDLQPLADVILADIGEIPTWLGL